MKTTDWLLPEVTGRNWLNGWIVDIIQTLYLMAWNCYALDSLQPDRN